MNMKFKKSIPTFMIGVALSCQGVSSMEMEKKENITLEIGVSRKSQQNAESYNKLFVDSWKIVDPQEIVSKAYSKEGVFDIKKTKVLCMGYNSKKININNMKQSDEFIVDMKYGTGKGLHDCVFENDGEITWGDFQEKVKDLTGDLPKQGESYLILLKRNYLKNKSRSYTIPMDFYVVKN